MNHLRRIFAAVVTLAGAALALATAPAAFATAATAARLLHRPRRGPPRTLIAGGGMPGWQITLIAVGAALAGAALAVLLNRAWAARKTHPATA